MDVAPDQSQLDGTVRHRTDGFEPTHNPWVVGSIPTRPTRSEASSISASAARAMSFVPRRAHRPRKYPRAFLEGPAAMRSTSAYAMSASRLTRPWIATWGRLLPEHRRQSATVDTECFGSARFRVPSSDRGGGVRTPCGRDVESHIDRRRDWATVTRRAAWSTSAALLA
jgi:hypothetical protein